jgi:hypothetical protein
LTSLIKVFLTGCKKMIQEDVVISWQYFDVGVMMMHLRHVLLHHHSLIVVRKTKHLVKNIKRVVVQFFLLHSAYTLPK